MMVLRGPSAKGLRPASSAMHDGVEETFGAGPRACIPNSSNMALINRRDR
jgi:hypothetical protein